MIRHEVVDLLEGAKSGDPALRASAVTGLRRLARRQLEPLTREAVQRALLAALADDDPRVRMGAVAALACLPVPDALPGALAALGDEHAIAEAAGRAVVALDPYGACDALCARAREGPESVRAAALTALRHAPVITATGWATFEDCLADSSTVVRSAALGSARELGRRGSPTRDDVVRIAQDGLRSASPYRREISLALVRLIDVPGWAERCREAAKDRDPMVRARAAREQQYVRRRIPQ